jgi:hypothetical protein
MELRALVIVVRSESEPRTKFGGIVETVRVHVPQKR